MAIGHFDRFRNGLKCLGVLDEMKNLEDVFCYNGSKTLTAIQLLSLFSYEYGYDKDSNKGKRERMTEAYFADFVLDLEGMKL